MAGQVDWKVQNRDSWDVLYQESVSFYWNGFSKDKSPSGMSAYEIYSALGVSNIKPEGESVVFYGDNELQEIIKVTPIFSSDNDSSGYISASAYTNENGWKGLRTRLSIKIPNRVLLDSKVTSLLMQMDFDKLAFLCKNVLGKELASFFSASDGQAAEDIKAHVKASFSQYKKSDRLSVMSTPELLATLGILDALNNQLQASCDDDNRVTEVDTLVSNIDSAIYRPLTVLLSSCISLGLYFPFGFNMSLDVGTSQATTLPALRAKIEQLSSGLQASTVAERIDFAGIVDVLYDHFSTTESSVQLNDSQAQGVDIGDAAVTSSEGGLSQKYDRGGAAGLNDDYAWEHFVPRMVSYNWESIRKGDQSIKDDSSLKDYKGMLHNLGYKIPDFTDINLRLEDSLPFELMGDIDGDYQIEWNFSGYKSELEVVYPTPPESSVKPMALCDLIARRANEPFTSF